MNFPLERSTNGIQTPDFFSASQDAVFDYHKYKHKQGMSVLKTFFFKFYFCSKIWKSYG